jgi:hypothetical protein
MVSVPCSHIAGSSAVTYSTDQPAVSTRPRPQHAPTPTHGLAYEIVQEQEHELMAERQIASLQDDAAPSGDLMTPRTVESVVNKLFEFREKKHWRVLLLGNDVKIREQVERFAKLLQWSDPVVKNALSAQSYDATGMVRGLHTPPRW